MSSPACFASPSSGGAAADGSDTTEATEAQPDEANERAPVLRSFWIGGFEGADHLDPQGRPLDMARANAHLALLDADYARAAERGIRTVRESIGWRLSETAPTRFDLQRPMRMARSARRHGVQILWTLMHYGTPPDVDLRDDAMIDRFAVFAAAVARALADETDEPPVYTLVNEINFLSWAVAHTSLIGPCRGSGSADGDDKCCGDVGDDRRRGEDGHGDDVHSSRESGYEIKRRLVRATLAGTEAVRHIDPRARFMQVEPLVHVVAPAGREDLLPLAAQVAGYQWQAWDLLAGRTEPGLGGSPDMLDLLGINHYHSGQWEVDTERRLQWHERDPRRRGLDELLNDAWSRYGRPMLVAETSHVGAGRALWLSDVASQVERARENGVSVCGICLYPLIDRQDWNDSARWHHSGLWDVALPGTGPLAMERLLNRPYAQMLERWQRRLPVALRHPAKRPVLLVLSQIRWDLMLHRVQHLMAHLCAEYQIVYVEEPVHRSGAPRFVRRCPMPGVEVLQPHTPCLDAGFDGPQVPLLCELLRSALTPQTLTRARVWLTTPAALPLLRALRLHPWVYDRAAAAPATLGSRGRKQWREREAALVRSARLVLASGPMLARAVGEGRPNVTRVFNSVDADHFAPAALQLQGSAAQEAGRLLAGIDGPRLVYIGTLDERLDLRLLAHLTEARPDWRIVLVGPLRLAGDRLLPRRPNLHWLGAQPYDLLPYLLASCQVALLPYVRGPRTASTNPPQLLEYLAARKPVVSTPLPDVVELHAGVAAIGADTQGFVRACEQALQLAHSPDPRRDELVDSMLARCSWAAAANRVRAALLHAGPAAGLPAARADLLECRT